MIERGRGLLVAERIEIAWPGYPRTDADTLLVGVSRTGFANDLGLDVQLGPDVLVNAWR